MDPTLVAGTLLETTTDGILAFDREFRYTAWNSVMERISGLRRDEVLGRAAFTLFPFLVETGEDDCFREALAGRTAVSYDRPFTVPESGRKGYFEGRYYPVREASGAVVGGMAVIRDVTAEHELQERESSFRLQARVLESMREGVSVTDEDGVIVYTNAAEDAMFGYDPGELVGQHVTVQNAYPPEENARRVAETIEALKREGSWAGEWLNRRKDGQPFVTRARITALHAGSRRYFVCVQEDVTEERQAREAMRDTVSQLTLALQASRLGPWRWDAATDLVTFGQRGAEIFGIPPGPHLTWTAMREMLHPDDREGARLAVERAIADKGDYDIEYRVQRPDGVLAWVAATGRPFYDGEGRVEGMLGMVQDVTDRKRSEQALVEETRTVETINRIGQLLAGELDLHKLLQALTDAATEISDAQFGSFFYNVVNEQGEAYMLYTLSGASAADFARFPMPRKTAIFGPTFEGKGIVRLDDVTRDPRFGKNPPYHGMPRGHLPVKSYLAVPVASRTGEVLGGLFFGHARPGVFTARHERILGGIAAQAAIALDNARLYKQARDAEQQARERAEALAEADRRKDGFLAMLAHELRNPLGAITNALHVMALTPPDDPGFERAREVAVRQVGLQTRLVDDLLDVSRIARGKIRLQREPVDLVDLVRQAAGDHQPGLAAAGLELQVDLPPAPVPALADRARLAQVLGNLLDNARKFTPRGGRVSIWLRRGEDGAEIGVRDTGAGIEADILPRLFTPFAQATRTLDHSQGGLGLGLALVKGLVELHPGGAVRVESAGPDLGTEFVITLPVEAAAAVAEEAPAPPPLPPALRVLVVEDIADVAETLASLLTLYGCQPRVAASGAEGVALAREFRPQVVLCDIGLPDGMNGLEVARRLRADPATAEARLVALTGFGAEDDRRRSLEAGFDSHLTKPVNPDLLLRALRDAAAPGAPGEPGRS